MIPRQEEDTLAPLFNWIEYKLLHTKRVKGTDTLLFKLGVDGNILAMSRNRSWDILRRTKLAQRDI